MKKKTKIVNFKDSLLFGEINQIGRYSAMFSGTFVVRMFSTSAQYYKKRNMAEGEALNYEKSKD